MRSNRTALQQSYALATFLAITAVFAPACSGDGGTPPVSSVGGSGGSGGGDVDSGTTGGEGGTSSGGNAGSGGGTGATGGTGGSGATGGMGASGGTGGSGATGGSGGSGTTGGSGGSGATGGSGGSGATGGSGGSGATGGSGGSDATGGSGGSGATGGSGGSGATGGSGGSSGAGGAPPDGGTGVTFVCTPSYAWDPLKRVDSIPNEHLGRLGGISPDELTLAWTATSGDIYVAERATFRDPFGTPLKVNTGAMATDRVALAPTGRTLVAVPVGRNEFVGFEKSSSTGLWSATDGLEFTQVRVAFEGGGLGSEPVLSSDKRSLFFIVTPPGHSPLFYESAWDTVQRSWGLPTLLTNAELQTTPAGKRRRPTGTSADGLTLFFFDEAVNLQRAAWRDAPAAPFRFFTDVGSFPEAATSARCDTLYYQGQDALGAGVFMAY
jgi:hypothetical protein